MKPILTEGEKELEEEVDAEIHQVSLAGIHITVENVTEILNA